MRVFITGATGFLGKALTLELMCHAEKIVILQRDDAFFSWHRTDAKSFPIPVRGDLRDIQVIERALSQYEITNVIHLAAQSDVRIAKADPLSTFESNVRGTWNLLEACYRQKVRRVIIASTDKYYGHTPPPYSESDPARASGIYETSKSCADLIAQSYAMTYGLPIAITRCGNFYGPGRLNWETLIPGTIKCILEGRKPYLRSDGTFRRDFMHIDDAVSAYMALAKSDARGPFNFGTGQPMRVIDVVNAICEEMGWKNGITILNAAQGEIVDQYLNTRRANNELGWFPKVKFEDGIRRTIEWYRSYLRA